MKFKSVVQFQDAHGNTIWSDVYTTEAPPMISNGFVIFALSPHDSLLIPSHRIFSIKVEGQDDN